MRICSNVIALRDCSHRVIYDDEIDLVRGNVHADMTSQFLHALDLALEIPKTPCEQPINVGQLRLLAAILKPMGDQADGSYLRPARIIMFVIVMK